MAFKQKCIINSFELWTQLENKSVIHILTVVILYPQNKVSTGVADGFHCNARVFFNGCLGKQLPYRTGGYNSKPSIRAKRGLLTVWASKVVDSCMLNALEWHRWFKAYYMMKWYLRPCPPVWYMPLCPWLWSSFDRTSLECQASSLLPCMKLGIRLKLYLWKIFIYLQDIDINIVSDFNRQQKDRKILKKYDYLYNILDNNYHGKGIYWLLSSQENCKIESQCNLLFEAPSCILSCSQISGKYFQNRAHHLHQWFRLFLSCDPLMFICETV